MKQHLVGGELLLRYILPVQTNDGHAQEQVEVIRLWAGEATQRNQKNSVGMVGTKMADTLRSEVQQDLLCVLGGSVTLWSVPNPH